MASNKGKKADDTSKNDDSTKPSIKEEPSKDAVLPQGYVSDNFSKGLGLKRLTNSRSLEYVVSGVAVVVILIILIVSSGSKPSAAKVTDTWTGNGKNNSWSTSANWTKGVPTNNDNLVFNITPKPSKNPSTAIESNNDLSGLSLNSIKFIGSRVLGGFKITGQSFNVSDGITDASPTPVVISSVGLTGSQDFNSQGFTSLTLGLNLNNNDLNIDSGTVILSKLEGSGSVSVNQGELELVPTNNNPNFSGNVTVASLAQLLINLPNKKSSVLGKGSVSINNGGRLTFGLISNATFTNPITLGSSNSSKHLPTIYASSKVSSRTGVSTILLTLSGKITLKNNAQVAADGASSGLAPVTYNLLDKPSGNFKLIPEPITTSIYEP